MNHSAPLSLIEPMSSVWVYSPALGRLTPLKGIEPSKTLKTGEVGCSGAAGEQPLVPTFKAVPYFVSRRSVKLRNQMPGLKEKRPSRSAV